MTRTTAIGDIHGCSAALRAIIDAIEPSPSDLIIPLGDFVDRGIDSKGVLDQLIELKNRCTLTPILGNHDQMMLDAFVNKANLQIWLNCGGDATLASYGSEGSRDEVPPSHRDFLKSCRSYFESETHIFVRANCNQDISLVEQDDYTLRWLSLREFVPQSRHSIHAEHAAN